MHPPFRAIQIPDKRILGLIRGKNNNQIHKEKAKNEIAKIKEGSSL
jgi:hypothetical protein